MQKTLEEMHTIRCFGGKVNINWCKMPIYNTKFMLLSKVQINTIIKAIFLDLLNLVGSTRLDGSSRFGGRVPSPMTAEQN